MTKPIIFLLTISVLIACQESSKPEPKVKQGFEMYQMSEMAALMERMFNENKVIKEKIEQGVEDIGHFSDDYLKIHSAVLTEPSDMDEEFKKHAKEFITAQQQVFENKEHRKENFNKMVNACVACHQKKCGGPIPRIKKLLIQ